MRDGQGNKLSSEEIEKVRSAEVKPGDVSLNRVSVDPGPVTKPRQDAGKDPSAPGTTTAPKF